MNEKHWWIVGGVVLKNKEFEAIVVIKNNSNGLCFIDNFILTTFYYDDNFDGMSSNEICMSRIKEWELTGVPFDCMPKWVGTGDLIEFDKDGSRVTFKGAGSCITFQTIDIQRCPKAWKGKTFKITDELRKLIR